jgi:DNA repair photolyase
MDKVNKKWHKAKGTIMFPTTHDITPRNIGHCISVLDKMLRAGNNVLIVSKPHLNCIQAICDAFPMYKEQILFRFTIGSMNNMTLQFWEPGAPTYDERKEALKWAFDIGYHTSVSSEPYLDAGIADMAEDLLPYINDAIWIGPMNKMETRVKFRGISYKKQQDPKENSPWTPQEIQKWLEVKSCQTLDDFKNLYARFKDNKKVKWKNAIKEALGLDIPDDIGMDV